MVARLVLAIVSLAATLVAAEITLRVWPALLPDAGYALAPFDAELGLPVHGAVAYHGLRGVRRRPNPEGFLDIEHEPRARPGVERVAFFGDSYVEALQVQLNETFWTILARQRGGRLETFAFGVSGWGTLHSWLAYQKLGPRYSPDTVVHLFVKNDPGDNLKAIADVHAFGKPSAAPSPDALGFEVIPFSPPHRSWKRWLVDAGRRHSLLARVAWSQRRQFQRERINPEPATPDQNAHPSTWPPKLLADAKQVTRGILARFADDVRGNGARFAVLYVPRGDAELRGELDPSDLWLPWLEQVCEELGIRLLDPTEALRERSRAGSSVYGDHWTPAGHREIAAVVARFLDEERPGQ